MADATHHEAMIEIYGCDPEPSVTEYIHATEVIHDGRGGVCRFDKSELNDLINMLASRLPNDAGKVKVVDLTGKTGV